MAEYYLQWNPKHRQTIVLGSYFNRLSFLTQRYSSLFIKTSRRWDFAEAYFYNLPSLLDGFVQAFSKWHISGRKRDCISLLSRA